MEDRIPSIPPTIAPVELNESGPLWSVMIPTYNCIHFIEDAIKSVLVQDPGMEKMQIEVIDDHSTDGDVEALVNRVGNGRVKFFQQEKNRGSLRNFETCLNRSRGKWVHILHGDDCIAPDFYKEIQFLFTRYPEAGAGFTNYFFIGIKGEILDIANANLLEVPGILENFLYQIGKCQLIQPPAIVVKRSVYEKLGSFYAVHFGEDWEMWSRIGLHYPVAYSPKKMAFYRVSNDASISNQSFITGQNIKDIRKVIDIIQGYLPAGQRQEIKKYAQAYYAIYCIRVANGLLSTNRKMALKQTLGALGMSTNRKTWYWGIRFFIMYISHFKQLQSAAAKIKAGSLFNKQ